MQQHPENEKRALRAQSTLEYFRATTGPGLSLEEAAGDLIGDIGHYCDGAGLPFTDIAAKGVATWKIEQTEPLGVSSPPDVSILFNEPPHETLHTALCIWEVLSERSHDAVLHPEVTRRREDIGVVAFRESVAILVPYVEAVYALLDEETRESFAFDFDIVPAILDTLQWDCEPFIVRDTADAAAGVTRLLSTPPLPDPVPVPADPKPPYTRSNALFEELFQPIERNDGQILWQHGAIPSDADARYWWSVVEGDSGAWYISPGFRVVNRLGYIRCRVPRAGDEADYPEYKY